MEVEDHPFVGFIKRRDSSHWSKVGGDSLEECIAYYAQNNLIGHLPTVIVVMSPDHGIWEEQEYRIKAPKIEVTRIK